MSFKQNNSIAIVQNEYRIGQEIYQQLFSKTNDNILLSPVGIQSLLCLLKNGAAGKTRNEIQAFVGLPDNCPQDIEDYSSKLIKGLPTKTTEGISHWTSSNGIFHRSSIVIRDSYKEWLSRQSNVLIGKLDIPEEIQAANHWVSEISNGKINTILDSNSKNAELIAVNVNSFIGHWKIAFKEHQTQQQLFHGEKIQSHVPMMSIRSKFKFVEYSKYQAIVLDYKDENYAAIAILPTEKSGLSHIIKDVSKIISNVLGSSELKQGQLQLPRFTIKSEVFLKPILQQQGITQLFEYGKADLGNMFINGSSVYVDDIQHKSIIQVNEIGTEAASLTKATLVGSLPEPENQYHMIVDRPFVFAVMHLPTKSMLYLCVVRNLE